MEGLGLFGGVGTVVGLSDGVMAYVYFGGVGSVVGLCDGVMAYLVDVLAVLCSWLLK